MENIEPPNYPTFTHLQSFNNGSYQPLATSTHFPSHVNPNSYNQTQFQPRPLFCSTPLPHMSEAEIFGLPSQHHVSGIQFEDDFGGIDANNNNNDIDTHLLVTSLLQDVTNSQAPQNQLKTNKTKRTREGEAAANNVNKKPRKAARDVSSAAPVNTAPDNTVVYVPIKSCQNLEERVVAEIDEILDQYRFVTFPNLKNNF